MTPSPDVGPPQRLRPGATPGRSRCTPHREGTAVDFAFLFNNFAELTITGLALGAIYALVALGYTMVYGVLQLINFAHSEVFMFGTFAVAWVVVYLPRHRPVRPEPAAHARAAGRRLVAAMLTSAAIALLLERVAYRPLIRQGRAQADHLDLRDRRVVLAGRDHGPARPDRRLVRPPGQPRQLRRPGSQRLLHPGHHRPARRVQRRQLPRHRRRPPGDRCRGADDVRASTSSCAAPVSDAASGRSPRTPSRRP